MTDPSRNLESHFIPAVTAFQRYEQRGEYVHTNMSKTDAWIRGVLAVLFIVIAAVLNEMAIASLLAAVVALVCAGTALTHSCPVYSLFGIDTHRTSK